MGVGVQILLMLNGPYEEPLARWPFQGKGWNLGNFVHILFSFTDQGNFLFTFSWSWGALLCLSIQIEGFVEWWIPAAITRKPRVSHTLCSVAS